MLKAAIFIEFIDIKHRKHITSYNSKMPLLHGIIHINNIIIISVIIN